jgi:hypothetical protein
MNEGQESRKESEETLAQALQRLTDATPTDRIEGKLETAKIPFEGFDEAPESRAPHKKAE